MNKISRMPLFMVIPIILTLTHAVSSTINVMGFRAGQGNAKPRGSSGGRAKTGRPHAPNDGRWHMKHHRNRI